MIIVIRISRIIIGIIIIIAVVGIQERDRAGSRTIENDQERSRTIEPETDGPGEGLQGGVNPSHDGTGGAE